MFVRDTRRVDGHRNQCKKCVNARMSVYCKEYHQTEKYKEYQRAYAKTEKSKASGKEYRQTAKYKEYKRKYQGGEKNKAYMRKVKKQDRYKNWEREYLKKEEVSYKVACRRVLNHRVNAGKVTKRNICEICYAHPTECHHDNYDKPLDFVELCKKCHVLLHQGTPMAI